MTRNLRPSIFSRLSTTIGFKVKKFKITKTYNFSTTNLQSSVNKEIYENKMNLESFIALLALKNN